MKALGVWQIRYLNVELRDVGFVGPAGQLSVRSWNLTAQHARVGCKPPVDFSTVPVDQDDHQSIGTELWTTLAAEASRLGSLPDRLEDGRSRRGPGLCAGRRIPSEADVEHARHVGHLRENIAESLKRPWLDSALSVNPNGDAKTTGDQQQQWSQRHRPKANASHEH
jgi:hypothetical protein